jgi:GT2 family glycosyltransferase
MPDTVFPTPLAIRSGLACLAEAGLLQRQPAPHDVQEPPIERAEHVSAIVVAFNGVRWLERLIPSLARQTHDPLEIIVVDNGSTDDTPSWLANEPQIRLVALPPGGSLAAAINRGAELAAGEYLLVLNQDIELEPSAVSELVRTARGAKDCGAVAAKLKFQQLPAFLNGLGNRVEGRSWGTDNAIGHLDLGQFDHWSEVPSCCFAATLIPRSAWIAIGPVDDGFQFYYEDVEWAYRARALGWRILVAPRAVVYHAFGGSSEDGNKGLPPRKLARVVHGRLRFALKLLPLRESLTWLVQYAREDARGVGSAALQWDAATIGAYLAGWGKWLLGIPGVLRTRHRMAPHRASPSRISRVIPDPVPHSRSVGLTWKQVMTEYSPLIKNGRTRSLPEFISARRPVLLIVSQDIVASKMAGPGLRYVEIARALRNDLDVVLATPNSTDLSLDDVQIVRYRQEDAESLKILVENADRALISGFMVEKFPFLHETETPLIVDLYDPLVLENLHYHLDASPEEQGQRNARAVAVTNRGIRLGDFFICGSERQRDFWLGALAANGRVNPENYLRDQSLRKLIDVVGIGLPERPPRVGKGLKGESPGIPADSAVVLWGGGIWNWLDPVTLVKAWPLVLKRCPHARLVFLGTRHPNPEVPIHHVAAQTLAIATQIGETDRTIFFHEWMSLEEREAVLAEADVGVSLHPVHVETRYALRYRVLDYLWSRLPVVVTTGDVASEWVEQHSMGCVVPPDDPAATAEAIVEVLSKPREAWARSFDAVHDELRWGNVVEPLRRYCIDPVLASADVDRGVDPIAARLTDDTAAQPSWLRAAHVLEAGGPIEFARRVWRSLEHRARRLW